jgi:hypothetical protein
LALYFFLSLSISVCVCETGLPPREDWNVKLAVTRTPFFCLSAFLSNFSADTLGLSLKITVPAGTVADPSLKTILDRRHLPRSRRKPVLHLPLDANTPNFPFGTVISQLNVPGSVMNSVKITLPLDGSNDFRPAAKLLFARNAAVT